MLRPMNRPRFEAMMKGSGTLDYERYLGTPQLLSCQKDFDQLCNRDELMFQVVHQSMELWMKLVAYTLLDLDERLQKRETLRVISLFGRVHKIMHQLIGSFSVLETMSPKEYQEIRIQLGNGSGQESPGFRTLLQMPPFLWKSFQEHYLDAAGLTVEQVYDSRYQHDEAYMVAEALVEYDELFQKLRYHHIQLIQRSIGLGARSLKGRPVELLQDGLRTRFFPELWDVRSRMTEAWGGKYGVKRDSLPPAPHEAQEAVPQAQEAVLVKKEAR
jgi:tryptophan 2,3-dioxygenase